MRPAVAAIQLALLGAFAVAALCRRAGASVALAASLARPKLVALVPLPLTVGFDATGTTDPMVKQVFDLVIFDEASQCFAERGIPAMYRGRQIVVTGDDKQLSPNDLYQVRYEEENQESEPALEVDSLLDLCKQFLMTVQLQEHYRSKSLSLIDFSNQHFYKNKLWFWPELITKL